MEFRGEVVVLDAPLILCDLGRKTSYPCQATYKI